MSLLKNYQNELTKLQEKVNYFLKLKILNYQLKIKNLEDKLILLDPRLALEKGYSLIYKNQIKVKSVNEINVDDEINLSLKDGIIKAIVKEIKDYGK